MRYIFLLAIALLSSSAEASEVPSVLENLSAADSLYTKGRYVEALQIYEQTAQLSGTSAEMLYNMGNAAVKANRYGTAMVAYQKAAAISPGNGKIRHNISYLLSKVDDRNNAKLGGKKGDVSHQEPTAIAALWTDITAHVSPDVWGWLAFTAFLLTLAGSICYVLSANVTLRKAGFFSALICIVLTVILNIFTVSAHNHWKNRRQCVITAFEATPLPKPDDNAKPELTPLVAGTLLSMPETDEAAPTGWVFVRLNESTGGWLPTADVTIL